ncbi:hypothetical protein BJY01DRAFT_28715 [Aspergillus pseudoustus]|uniref:F-box domain-containing protein n=1 Tax=Aspergillus pseudoustus TaxID=1810923 RepID=A0ABR4JJH1_9EURO
MLSELPLEILLQITGYIESEVLLDLYQVSRRLYQIFEPQLREIYRVKIVDLGRIKNDGDIEINIRPHLTGRRALKFVEELTIDGRCEYGHTSSRHRPHLNKCVGDLALPLMSLLRGLKRNSLVSFRWLVDACPPPQILGPRGYLRRHQRNIQTLELQSSSNCAHNNADKSQKLSISRFHRIRSFSWRSATTTNDITSLKEFLSANADRLEELTLGVGRSPRINAEYNGTYGDWATGRNMFPFHVLGLERGSTRCLFPCLRKLDLIAPYAYAYTELAYAFQMHKLVHVKPHSFHMLRKMVEIAEDGMLPLTSLAIHLDEERGYLLDEELFALSLPNLQDVFFPCVYATDQSSVQPHLREAFSGGRKLRRFVYCRRLTVRGDAGGAWEPTVAPMAWDAEIMSLLADAELRCVGLCDHLPTLQFYLSPNPPTTWEILHIQHLATIHEEYHPHQPAFTISYDEPLRQFRQPLPPSIIDLTTYKLRFPAVEIAEVLTFAKWAFGPAGLPNLDLFVFGPVETREWERVLGECIFLTRNEDLITRGAWPCTQVQVEDEEVRRRFEQDLEFFTVD